MQSVSDLSHCHKTSDLSYYSQKKKTIRKTSMKMKLYGAQREVSDSTEVVSQNQNAGFVQRITKSQKQS